MDLLFNGDRLHVAPAGVVVDLADRLVGADANIILLFLGQLIDVLAGVLAALDGDRLGALELGRSAVLYLIAGDLGVLLPVCLQLFALVILHAGELDLCRIDGDGNLLGRLLVSLGGAGGDRDGGLAHEVLCDGHLAVFVRRRNLDRYPLPCHRCGTERLCPQRQG